MLHNCNELINAEVVTKHTFENGGLFEGCMPIEVMAKVRYRAKLAEATLYPQVEGKVKVEFKNPQRAITPGQSVVFYIENILLGGGKISSNV